MNKFLLAVFLFPLMAQAQDAQKFCEFLLSRTKTSAPPSITQLADIAKAIDKFPDLAKDGVEKKMSWASFKKFAHGKGSDFSDYFQSQYDRLYMDRYCGKASTETGVKIEGGIEKVLSSKTTFERKPNPAEHEYSKELSGNQ